MRTNPYRSPEELAEPRRWFALIHWREWAAMAIVFGFLFFLLSSGMPPPINLASDDLEPSAEVEHLKAPKREPIRRAPRNQNVPKALVDLLERGELGKPFEVIEWYGPKAFPGDPRVGRQFYGVAFSYQHIPDWIIRYVFYVCPDDEVACDWSWQLARWIAAGGWVEQAPTEGNPGSVAITVTAYGTTYHMECPAIVFPTPEQMSAAWTWLTDAQDDYFYLHPTHKRPE